MAPLLIGVARDHGARVEPSTPLHSVFERYKPFANWDERKSRITVVFPELDLATAVNAGDYRSGNWYRWMLEAMPKYIIPAATMPR